MAIGIIIMSIRLMISLVRLVISVFRHKILRRIIIAITAIALIYGSLTGWTKPSVSKQSDKEPSSYWEVWESLAQGED